MAHLLHIDTSSSPTSVSRRLAAAFREVWDAEQPDATVTYRDLAADPVPHVDGDAVFTLMAEPLNDEQREAAELHHRLTEEIITADALLISAPMYNWTIPSNLKAWFDQSLVLGRTLPFDPSMNPLASRPATLLLAFGGDYGTESPDADMNHCTPYLRTVVEKVLGYDTRFIVAEHTIMPYTSQDPAELAKAADSLQQAVRAAGDRAREVAGSFVRA